jgi:hypothetical protein
MPRDASSNRPRPVRAGAAPTTRESAPVPERFPVVVTVEATDGTRWDVRVGGRTLAGRPQAGRDADHVPELLLLLFAPAGAEEPEREALVPAAGLVDAEGGLRPRAVLQALDAAGPYAGTSPRSDAFFEGTRRRRGR